MWESASLALQNADLAAFHREASAAARYGDATNFVLTDLHVIAGQLAVSLDNALLYASLKRKVAERTQALELANQELAALSADAALYAAKQGGRHRVGGAV